MSWKIGSTGRAQRGLTRAIRARLRARLWTGRQGSVEPPLAPFPAPADWALLSAGHVCVMAPTR